MPVSERKHPVRDIAVRMLRGGSGAPLVYLHSEAGLPESSPFLDALSERFDLLVPEHPGFGLSDNPPWIRNIADMAMYYLDLLDELGLPHVHLVGHSLGGWIAAEVAIRNTSRLASLTLVAPAGIRVKGVPIGDTFIWSPEELAHNLFHDASFAERRLAQVPTQEQADIALTNRFATAKLAWEPRWFDPALERWLHRITVPTLLLWGREDKLFPSSYAETWARRIPRARVEIIPHCGHLPQVEKTDAVTRCILDFLDGR